VQLEPPHAPCGRRRQGDQAGGGLQNRAERTYPYFHPNNQ